MVTNVNHAEIKIKGKKLVLLPESAVYIPSEETLLIADLHLGKVEHFRLNGIGIPSGATQKDIENLEVLITTYLPHKVVFLGDLFHSKYNSSWKFLLEMIVRYRTIEFHLVLGNHDILNSKNYSQFITCTSYNIGEIVCTHEPLDVPISESYNLCGHIHPGVRLKGRGKQTLRLPCYYFTAEQGILPAFGSFTGLHTIKPLQGDIVYVIAENSVVSL